MKDKIIKALMQIDNLYTGQKLNIQRNIKKIDYNEETNKVILKIDLFQGDKDKNKSMQRMIVKSLKLDLKIAGVKIEQITNSRIKGKSNSFPKEAKIIAIISGKGGVGKSNVSYNIAKGLTNKGKKVALIDLDIYGYSLQKLTNTYEKFEEEEGLVVPLKKEGIEMISTQHFIEDNNNDAVVWRGPMLNKMMGNFFKYVNFSKDIDYVVIDTPPGTGDVFLNLISYFDEINAVIVTTPESLATHVTLRAGKLAKELRFNLLGVVENMSYLKIEDKKHYIYGKGGGEEVAKSLNVDLLGQINIISQELAEEEKEKIINEDYQQIIEKIINKVNKK